VLATIAPYLVALSAMAFAGLSALTLIHTVSHLDPTDAESTGEIGRSLVDVPEQVAV
jgi:hypothetical protein